MALANHVADFQVKNFKSFEDLNVQNLGWVNLIVGDNNVGKTSLLEALHFHADRNSGFNVFRDRLVYILSKVRGFEDFSDSYLEFFINRNKIAPDHEVNVYLHTRSRGGKIKWLRFNYRDKYPHDQEFATNAKEPFGPDTNTNEDVRNGLSGSNTTISEIAVPYIPVNMGYQADLVSHYSRFIQQSAGLKRQLLEDLSVLIPDMESLEPAQLNRQGTIVLFLRGSDVSIPLPLMGEGAIKLFRILSEIIVWKGQRLMIDEIDTGFHHSRMRAFWKTILASARQHETQLFVTTHNLECIQHLKNALQEDMPDFQDEVRVVRLARVKDQVKAYTYTYPEFESAIENENELR